MNHFLAEFKHRIESNWVSPTTIHHKSPESILGARFCVPLLVHAVGDNNNEGAKDETGNSQPHE